MVRLITGTSGMMGSHLYETLISQGKDVVPTFHNCTLHMLTNEEKIIIHPKQGKMVRFPSNTRHSANVPFNYETRIVLNMVFDPLLS